MVRLSLSHLLILFCLVPGSIFAQDSHYWDIQYGTDAQLLGGVVVGDISDLSAVYYNPGAVALTKEQYLILTTNGFKGTNINFENLYNKTLNVNFWKFSVVPGIIALRIMGKKENDWHLSFSFLTRHDFEYNTRVGSFTSYTDPLPPDGSYEAFEALIVAELYEGWGGVSFSKALNKDIGIGVTQFVAYRSQRKRVQFSGNQINDLSNDSQLAISHFDYYNLRTFWKFGIIYDLKKVTLGLNLTTPSLNLFGMGDTFIQVSESGTNLQPDSLKKLQYSIDEQNGIASHYKSPLAVAFGLSWKFEDTKVHFTAEWFNAINVYNVLAPSDFRSQATGEMLSYSYHTQAEMIVNYGLAVTHRISDQTSIFGGFITDYSANPNEFSDNISISSWDIYHLNLGGSFIIFDYAITTGISFGFGNQKVNNEFDLIEEKLESDAQFQARYFSIKFIMGLTL